MTTDTADFSGYMITDAGFCTCHLSGKEHCITDECRALWNPIDNPRCGPCDQHREIHYWTGDKTGSPCECGARRRPLNWGKPHGEA